MYIMCIYLSSLQQRMARGPNHAHQGLSSKGPSSESWEAMFNPTQQLPAQPENTNLPALFCAYRAFHLSPLQLTMHHFLKSLQSGRDSFRLYNIWMWDAD